MNAATRFLRRVEIPPRLQGDRGRGSLLAAAAIGAALLPLTASEVTIYKFGLVLIFVVGALGLQVLVNWAGQLSLAHAGMVGLPAFAVLALSEIHGISPIYLLPVGVVVGGGVGAVVALPTLRAKGLQVALVTLAAGIGIDRYFFTSSWLVGAAGGRSASLPRLGGLEFTTSRSLYPVLLAVVVAAAVAIWMLMHSKVARAWFWVRSDPAAAAAFGVPVVAYRILAFATGGALAGLAGGLTVMWVQRLTPAAFPTTLSYTYLLVAVLAGPGYIGGLAVAAVVLEGGRLFSTGAGTVVAYTGPIALVLTITRYQAGLNGAGRSVMERLRLRGHFRSAPDVEPEPISLSAIGGVLALLAGFIVIGVAWYHTGNTDQTWIQNQELISGGIGGLGLVVLGTGLLIRDRLIRTHSLLVKRWSEPASAAPTEAANLDTKRRARPRKASA